MTTSLIKTLRHKLCARPAALVCILLCAGLLLSCSDTDDTHPVTRASLVDSKATAETRALYLNLQRLSPEHVLFGHQDALAYGVLWEGEDDRSDIRDVVGSHPAVYGWELGNLELGAEENLDKVSFQRMRGWMQAAYQRGGVITLSWHMNSPVTGGNAWDTRPTVEDIIPGGTHHHQLKAYLDVFVQFNEQLALVDEQGKKHYIPIIFRPWHEHNGDWFWWGKGHTSEADYIALWRFTVNYLRDQKRVHNLLYSFSPDRSRMAIDNIARDYVYGYPGDDYVDIIGLDNYWDLGHPANHASAEQQREDFARSLQAIVAIADEKGKVAALTEGGQEALPDPHFWSQTVLPAIKAKQLQRKVAYMMFWRNANREREGRDHFYVPYEGHASAEDLLIFSRHSLVLFENELPDMYVAP